MLEQLNIPRGVTAIIGSGGKTSLLEYLAEHLPGRRIICTTTKIYRPVKYPLFTGDDLISIIEAMAVYPVVCVGSEIPEGKIAAPLCPYSQLRDLCDYLIIEADGSRQLPLKAHLAHEPVIPPVCDRIILVAGLSGLWRPIASSVHRSERFAALCKKSVSDLVTPEDLAIVIRKENLADMVILNQFDTGNFDEAARIISDHLSCPVLVGSIKQSNLHSL